MAFHSYQFILGVLPVVFLGFVAAHRFGGWPMAFNFLAVASLAFYAQFGWGLLGVLLVSVTGNWLAGGAIIRAGGNRKLASMLLSIAIAANLLALGYLKYANFFVDIVNQLSRMGVPHMHLVVPIGVSFFTFVQIGYLIDAYNGQVEAPSFPRYVLFATFFPAVTAGPLVLQREMFAQMKDRTDVAFDPERIAVGLTLFGIGLFKKVVLADAIAPFADDVFNGAAQGLIVSPSDAWIGAVSYALQLYFDFSGYSDMAIGLGCVFGLRLPLNFDSPFKASSISDFWRRWHMTMTRFFTTYVYTPLAMRGMRRALGGGMGTAGRLVHASVIPVVVTFLVAGIWHGAGWPFVVYGLIHGFALAVNQSWRELKLPHVPAVVGWALTMCVVVTGLVVFRAPDLATSGVLLSNMWAAGWHVTPMAAAVAVDLDVRTAIAMIIVLGSIALLMPNSQQILNRSWVSCDPMPNGIEREAGLLSWKPKVMQAFAIALVSAVAFASIGASTTFLYYQF